MGFWSKGKLVDMKALPGIGTMRLYRMEDGHVQITCTGRDALLYEPKDIPEGMERASNWKELLFEHAAECFKAGISTKVVRDS